MLDYGDLKTADDQTRSPLEDVPSLENAQRPSRRNPLRRFCLGAVVGAILLAIALGAGLGVGLKKKSSSAHPSLASMSSDGSDRNVQVPPASNFVLRGQQALAQEPATTRYYDFVLEQRYGAPDGFNKTMLVVNGGFTRVFAGEWRPRRTQIPLPAGMYPGPTIEVNSDDRIVVNVTNLMPNATAVRIHAFRADRLRSRDSPSAFRLDPLARTVPARYALLRRYKWSHPGGHKPTPPNRAFAAESLVFAQCGIPPGSSLVYNFTLDGWVGSTWWHAHMSTQYTDGLSGALIVHNRTEKLVAQVDGELSIQLSDLYHRFSDDLLVQYLSRAGMTGEGLAGVTQGNEPVPDSGTINGVGNWGSFNSSFPNYTLTANSTYRLRLANTGSFAAASFSVDDHPLTVVEADGVLVEPFTVSSLDIDVAQRYSVLLTTNQTAGAYWMRYTVSQDAFTYTEQSGNYDILGVLRYGVDDAAMPASSEPGNSSAVDSLPAFDVGQLVPADAQNPPAPNQSVSLSLAEPFWFGHEADTVEHTQVLYLLAVYAKHGQ